MLQSNFYRHAKIMQSQQRYFSLVARFSEFLYALLNAGELEFALLLAATVQKRAARQLAHRKTVLIFRKHFLYKFILLPLLCVVLYRLL